MRPRVACMAHVAALMHRASSCTNPPPHQPNAAARAGAAAPAGAPRAARRAPARLRRRAPGECDWLHPHLLSEPAAWVCGRREKRHPRCTATPVAGACACTSIARGAASPATFVKANTVHCGSPKGISQRSLGSAWPADRLAPVGAPRGALCNQGHSSRGAHTLFASPGPLLVSTIGVHWANAHQTPYTTGRRLGHRNAAPGA